MIDKLITWGLMLVVLLGRPEAEQAAPEAEPAQTMTMTAAYLGEFKAYSYDICKKCCGKTDGITASGEPGVPGKTAAVDTSIIPLGSRLLIRIDGQDSEWIAQDTGAGITGNKLDLLSGSHEQALQFGVKKVEVWLIKEGKHEP